MLNRKLIAFLGLELQEVFALQSDGQKYRFTITGLERLVDRRGSQFWKHVEDCTLEDIIYGRDYIHKLEGMGADDEEEEL